MVPVNFQQIQPKAIFKPTWKTPDGKYRSMFIKIDLADWMMQRKFPKTVQ